MILLDLKKYTVNVGSKAILLISHTQGWVRLILLDNPQESSEALRVPELFPRALQCSFCNVLTFH